MNRFVTLLYIYMVCVGFAYADEPSSAPAHTDTTAVEWYNLGNAHYRKHEMAQAVLCYEKALRLNPSDDDAAYNLELCRASLPDRFATPHEMFFVSWFKTLVYGNSYTAWLVWSVVLLALSLVFLLWFRHANRSWAKRCAFFSFALLLLVLLFSLLSAGLTYHKFTSERRAVVMNTTPVRERSTRTAPPIRQLHPGTSVTLNGILSPDGLTSCSLPDGTEVWIEQKDIEEVNP